MKINDIVDEVSMKPRALQAFAGSGAVAEMTIGWEAEMIVPGLSQPKTMGRRSSENDTLDWSYDEQLPVPEGIDRMDFMRWKRQLENFFCHRGEVENGTRLVDTVTDDFEDDYENWLVEKLEDDPRITPVIRQHISQLINSTEPADINTAFYDRGTIYDRAVGETLREMKKFNLWKEFMEEQQIRTYKEFAQHYNLEWPYLRASEKHLEFQDIADSFPLGKMQVGEEYHSVERRANLWIIEPDESLEPPDDYGAAEIISPVMTAPDALKKLKPFLSWCERIGAEGHETTGFHINVGPPSQNTEDIDPVKLILFMGDNYVLQEFGRLLSYHGRSYAASTIDKLKAGLKKDIEKARFDPQRVINSLRRYAVPAAGAMVRQLGEIPGRRISINIKDEYVEFRAAGGDWMSKQQELINTINRCLFAMSIAVDPYAEQREYAVKLYKLMQSAINQETGEELEEGPVWDRVKKQAQGAALGAGIIGAAAGMNVLPQLPRHEPAAYTQQEPEEEPDQEPAAAVTPADEVPNQTRLGKHHPNFPDDLKDVSSFDPNSRVKTFTKVMLPLIDAQNQNITAQRTALLNIARSSRPTDEQREYVSALMRAYAADDLQDLLLKVDVIPRSLALAQAAVESGWGTDEKAQRANVFFGQKQFKPGGVEGPYGERYAGFESPEDAVRAYMKNLNTHDAYEKFRQQRAQLRRAGKPISGKLLARDLEKYSTRGKHYTSQVSSIISNRGLDKLD
jgi:Bax protein